MSRARDLGSSINSTAAGKNLIINGAFDFWQRGSSLTTLTGNSYLADRWCGGQRFQAGRHQRVSLGYQNSELNSQYAIRIGTSTTSEFNFGTRMRLSQTIESLNTYPLRGKTVTLSFWVRFSAATISSITNTTDSTYGSWTAWIPFYSSTTDSNPHNTGEDGTVGNLLSITQGQLPTTWTKYTISGLVPTNANNIGVTFAFSALGSTTSADQHWYEIAQVQLELGTSATQFSRAGGDIQGELAACQRYFQSSFPIGTTPQNNISPGIMFTMSNNANLINGMPFPVPMRITPSFLTYNPYNTNSSWRKANGSTDITITSVIPNGNMGIAYVGTSGFTVTGSDSIHGHWIANAEL